METSVASKAPLLEPFDGNMSHTSPSSVTAPIQRTSELATSYFRSKCIRQPRSAERSSGLALVRRASAFGAYGPAGLSVAALPVPPAPGVASAHALVPNWFVQAPRPRSKSSLKAGMPQSVLELTIAVPGAPTSTVVKP